ncbi:MAG: hypothetical protein AAFW75_24215, partial [Cyanobacteria bacterium J06636_16]
EGLGESPKETLVQEFLAYVVHDCGPPNERLAWVVLYLLTDEDRDQRLYRPLKTREEIEYELSLLEMPFELDQLSMVLSILVGSGLAFEIPEEPEDRYQLVHDYLVRYVRNVQTPGLMAELEAARQRQRQAEENERIAKLRAEQLVEANLILEQAEKEASALLAKARIQSNISASVTISVLITSALLSKFFTFEETLITLVIAILILGILLPYFINIAGITEVPVDQLLTVKSKDISKKLSDLIVSLKKLASSIKR